MRITIENFGAIKYFEFDTDKDMYLIFGKNSVGKSYGISLVYLILKLFKQRTNLAISTEIVSFLQNQTLNNELTNHNLAEFLNCSFVADLNNSLINSFNNIDDLQNQLSDEELKITLDSRHFRATLDRVKKNSDSMAIQIVDYQSKQPFIDIIEWYTNPTSGLDHNQAFIHVINDFYNRILEEIYHVYYLPASRSGLYQGLGSFAQIAAEFSKSRNLISKSIHLPSISEPLADYFLLLSQTNSKKQSGLLPYTDDIENEIMSGKVEFDDETKRLFFKPIATELKLDLSSTSSMVSEIAPIVAYLKHILPNVDIPKTTSKPLLFIEEPEAHLHPETQVKLMNVFARLVKDDKIKLVMTSHSNYIFNKASNLVMDGKIEPDKFKAVLFRMTETGSVAEDMATDAYGIDDDNFIDTAESLYEEKLAIIDKLNG